MSRAQWEDCKVCGGDHWTKDHPIGHPYSPSIGFLGCCDCGRRLVEHADKGPGDARESVASPARRHAAALMAYVLQGSETSPTVEESFEMANRLLDFAESGEMRKTTAIPSGARLVIDAPEADAVTILEATAAAEQRLRDARQAVALLDSMIRSGERHSAQSEAIVHAALLNL